MFCTSCGKELPDDALFCTDCGESMSLGEEGAVTGVGQEPSAEPAGGSSDSNTLLIIGCIVAGLAVIAAVVFLLLQQGGRDAEVATVPISGVTVSGGTSGDQAPEAAALGSAGVPVRASTGDYSWSELSLIGDEIARQKDASSALKVAGEYHLTDSDGKLDGSQSREVVLGDGTIVHARIVGFAHDTDASGAVTGITFAFDGAAAKHNWNDGTSNSGGWEASGLRRWMNSELVFQLPSELTEFIVPVQKRASRGPDGRGSSGFAITVDRLWEPSLVELVGQIDMASYERAYGSPSADMRSSMQGWFDVWNGEGSQYQLYREAGVGLGVDSGMLTAAKLFDGADGSESCAWWGRSTSSDGHVQSIDAAGRPHKSTMGPNQVIGVVPYFCLGLASHQRPEAASGDDGGSRAQDSQQAAGRDEAAEKEAEAARQAEAEAARQAEAAAARRAADREAERKLRAEEFAYLYIANCEVADSRTGETESIPNRPERIMEYVEPGSALEAQLDAQPRDAGGDFLSSAAVVVHDTSANSVDGDMALVAVSYSATQGNRPNWLDESQALMLHCTFSEDDLISSVQQDGTLRLTGNL